MWGIQLLGTGCQAPPHTKQALLLTGCCSDAQVRVHSPLSGGLPHSCLLTCDLHRQAVYDNEEVYNVLNTVNSRSCSPMELYNLLSDKCEQFKRFAVEPFVQECKITEWEQGCGLYPTEEEEQEENDSVREENRASRGRKFRWSGIVGTGS